MHLLIPFAFCCSDGCAAALPSLRLPHLEKLLSRLTPMPLDAGDEFSLSPPHERALAIALGLPVADGLIPWAAHQSQCPGAWGFVTPCHWRAGAKHIAMSGAGLPDFSESESQHLLAAMQPYFEEDGITLRYESPARWLAHGDAFDALATASLDRVVGRDVKAWLSRASSATRLQRLQTEMQMLLYNHPVNDARLARGAPPVNAFWVSGTGALPVNWTRAANEAAPVVVSTLRQAALQEDWAAWAQAWQTLDATECAALLHALHQARPVQLTLCGERNAQSFGVHRTGYLKRLMNIVGHKPPSTLLEKL